MTANRAFDRAALVALIDACFIVLTVILRRFVSPSWQEFALALAAAVQPIVAILAVHFLVHDSLEAAGIRSEPED